MWHHLFIRSVLKSRKSMLIHFDAKVTNERFNLIEDKFSDK